MSSEKYFKLKKKLLTPGYCKSRDPDIGTSELIHNCTKYLKKINCVSTFKHCVIIQITKNISTVMKLMFCQSKLEFCGNINNSHLVPRK